jgi:hypothetical protein
VPMTRLSPHHPKSLERVIQRLLSKPAGDRYPNAAELSAALLTVEPPHRRFGERLRRLFHRA